MPVMTRRLLRICGLAVATLPAPASAFADELVDGKIVRTTELAAYGDWTAWIADSGTADRTPQVLVRGRDRRITPLGVDARMDPRDVAVGPGRDGVHAVVVRCDGRGCGLARVRLRDRRRAVIASARDGVGPRTQAAVWGGTVVFTRVGPACDDLFAIRSGRIARVPIPCLRIADIALRRDQVALSAVRDLGGRFREEVRALRLSAPGRERLLLGDGRTAVSEDALRPGQVAIDDHYAYVARAATGRAGCVPSCGIERVSFRNRRVRWALPANILLTGGLARLGDGRMVYQHAAEAEDGRTGDCTPDEQLLCGIALSSVDPFGDRPHALLPVPALLTQDGPRYPQTGMEITLTGILAARVVVGEQVIGSQPRPGVVVKLRERAIDGGAWVDAASSPATTDADGRFTLRWPASTGQLTVEAVDAGAAYERPGIWRTMSRP